MNNTDTTLYGKVVKNLTHQLEALSKIFSITKNKTAPEENLRIKYSGEDTADKTIDIGLFKYDEQNRKLILFHSNINEE